MAHKPRIRLQYRMSYLDGCADAAMGVSPQRLNDRTYMRGYFDRLRIIATSGDAVLQVRWISKSYINGAYDGGEAS